MTKRDIIISVSEKTKLTQKDVRRMFEETMQVIAEALLNGEQVELRNFGVFEVQVRKSRIGRNPNQPSKSMIIPEHRVIKFKVGKSFRERLNQPDGKEKLSFRD